MRKGTLLPMRLGQEIKVITRYKNSTVGFLTRIVGRRREPIPYLIINKPEVILPIKQKREYVRLNVSLPVRFKIIDEEDKNEIEEGITIDISAGGVLFSTKAEVKKGQKIEIEITLSLEKTFSCQADAIRIFEKAENNAIWVAVEYNDISEADRDRIFKFIFEKQREWIKKGIT